MVTRTQSPSPVAGSNLVARFYSRDGDQIVPAGSVALDHAGRAIFDRQAADFLRDATIIDVLGGKFQTVGPEQGAKYIANLPFVYDGTYFWARLEEDYYTPAKGWASGYESKYSANQPRHPRGSSHGGQFAGTSRGVQQRLPHMPDSFNYDAAGRLIPGGTFQPGPGGGGGGGGGGPYDPDGVRGTGDTVYDFDDDTRGGAGGGVLPGTRDGEQYDLVEGGGVGELESRPAGDVLRDYYGGVLDGTGFDDVLAGHEIEVDHEGQGSIGGSSEVYKSRMVVDGQGVTVYVKPRTGLYDSGRIHDDIPDQMDLEHERAATLLNRELGGLVHMPAQNIVHVDGYGESGVQIKGSGEDFSDLYGKTYHESLNGDHSAYVPAGAKARHMADVALFDTIIGNYDRHEGNLKWDADSERVIPIDHGLAFPEMNGYNGMWNQTAVQAAHAMRAADLRPDHMAMLAHLKDNEYRISRGLVDLGLSQSQVDAMFVRIDALRNTGRLPTPNMRAEGVYE
jgi:hypothetical protein